MPKEKEAEFAVREPCERCGATFSAPAALDEGHPGETITRILHPVCPACTDLGFDPGVCCAPECSELFGEGEGGSVAFVCEGGHEIGVEELRALRFGQACMEIARGAAGIPAEHRAREVFALFTHRARTYGVTR